MISYKDTVYLVNLSVDGYNDKTISTTEEISALFHLGASYSNQDGATLYGSDAHVYLNPKNSVVMSNAYRLEGWYVVASIFGGDLNEGWYRIETVVVGQQKLLSNNVDNVHCFLKKVAAPVELEVS